MVSISHRLMKSSSSRRYSASGVPRCNLSTKSGVCERQLAERDKVEVPRHRSAAFAHPHVLIEAELFLPWSAQKARGAIFASCEALDERAEEDGMLLRVRGETQAIKALREQIG